MVANDGETVGELALPSFKMGGMGGSTVGTGMPIGGAVVTTAGVGARREAKCSSCGMMSSR